MVAMTQMSTPSPQPSASTPIRVGPHELSVVGVVAVSRTAACTRYAKDADRAPQMAARVDLLRMSAWEVSSFDRVVALASAHGIDAAGAAERFTDVLGDLDERLRPLDWAERLVKTYIAFGLLIDFGMALSDSLAEPLRSGLIDELGQDLRHCRAGGQHRCRLAAGCAAGAVGKAGRRRGDRNLSEAARPVPRAARLRGSRAVPCGAVPRCRLADEGTGTEGVNPP